MSDFDNLQMLKKMLEGKSHESEQEIAAARERRFIADVTKASLADSGKDINGIQSYKPEQIVEFIKSSGGSLQSILGGEWAEMDAMAFDAISYTVMQKMQKSASLINWNS